MFMSFLHEFTCIQLQHTWASEGFMIHHHDQPGNVSLVTGSYMRSMYLIRRQSHDFKGLFYWYSTTDLLDFLRICKHPDNNIHLFWRTCKETLWRRAEVHKINRKSTIKHNKQQLTGSERWHQSENQKQFRVWCEDGQESVTEIRIEGTWSMRGEKVRKTWPKDGFWRWSRQQSFGPDGA